MLHQVLPAVPPSSATIELRRAVLSRSQCQSARTMQHAGYRLIVDEDEEISKIIAARLLRSPPLDLNIPSLEEQLQTEPIAAGERDTGKKHARTCLLLGPTEAALKTPPSIGAFRPCTNYSGPGAASIRVRLARLTSVVADNPGMTLRLEVSLSHDWEMHTPQPDILPFLSLCSHAPLSCSCACIVQSLQYRPNVLSGSRCLSPSLPVIRLFQSPFPSHPRLSLLLIPSILPVCHICLPGLLLSPS